MAQTPCIYRQDGATIDYTPGAAVAGGTVYVLGSTIVTIVPVAIAATDKGATAVRGVFNVPKDNSDVAAGDALYWDADGTEYGGGATGAFTKTATGNVFAGIALEAAGTTTADVDMLLRSIDGTVPGSWVPMPSATVAATGSTQSDAALIATGFTLVSAADATKGVKLPAASAGLVCVIKNNVNAVLKVWPNTDDAINAIAANSNYVIAALSSCMLVSYNGVTWYSVPLVAS